MKLNELKDRIEEIWNEADIETKVDKEVYIYNEYNDEYEIIKDIIIDDNDKSVTIITT